MLVMPVTQRLAGSTQNTSEFAELEGDFPRLLRFLARSWTLAALIEELAFRGHHLTRITDLIGTSVAGRVAAVVGVAFLSCSSNASRVSQEWCSSSWMPCSPASRARLPLAVRAGRGPRSEHHRRDDRVVRLRPVLRTLVSPNCPRPLTPAHARSRPLTPAHSSRQATPQP